MAFVFPVLALFGVFVLCQRSIGLGLLGVFVVGYFSGIVRANFQSIATTFFFDAAIIGLYSSFLVGHTQTLARSIRSTNGQIVLLLLIWPLFLVLIPVNHFLVQLVALRSSIFLLPLVWIAIKLKRQDIAMLTRGFAVLNIIAALVGIYLYIYGVPALYPRNEVTRIIYNSKDVVGDNFRIPSTFLSAHAFGCTMVLTIPYLVGMLVRMKTSVLDRALLSTGILSSIVGILLCAARQPLWILALFSAIAWLQTGLSIRTGLVILFFGGICVYLGATNERFQRGFALTEGQEGTAGYVEDKLFVFNRMYNSINEDLLDVFIKYPMGAGMGSAFGTSIPYFLAQYQPEFIGSENEYSRILVDQGWIGLGLWLLFVFKAHFPLPSTVAKDDSLLFRMLHSNTMIYWATAFIGTGTLSSVPASAVLLTSMGLGLANREHVLRHKKKLQSLRSLQKKRRAMNDIQGTVA